MAYEESGERVDLFGVNNIVDGMVSEDQPLVPRVDKHVGKERWGVDTPMFDSKEDMHGFLQGIGMAPGGLPADLLDSMLYMSEGGFADAIISMGAAIPVLGNLAPMRYGGKVQRGKRFQKTLGRKQQKLELEQMKERSIAREDLSLRDAERHWDEVDTKVALEKQRKIMGNLTERHGTDYAKRTVDINLTPREKNLIEKYRREAAEIDAFNIKSGINPSSAARNKALLNSPYMEAQMKKDVMGINPSSAARNREAMEEFRRLSNMETARKAGSVDEVTDLLHRLDKDIF